MAVYHDTCTAHPLRLAPYVVIVEESHSLLRICLIHWPAAVRDLQFSLAGKAAPNQVQLQMASVLLNGVLRNCIPTLLIGRLNFNWLDHQF